MPDSNRTICALSAPVTVFLDEFMAELVQKLSKEVCSEVLQATLLRSQDRLLAQNVRNRRSDAYKARVIAHKMVERLRPIPPGLAVLVGEVAADQAPVEGMTVDKSDEDDFATITEDLPDFKQFASVFKQYPYFEIRDVPSLGKLLVLGYCSGRGRTTNKLYRRNCTLVMPDGRRTGFRQMASAIGNPDDTGPDGTHYMIKAVPYVDGMALKFWTNLIGERDVPDQYRYLVLSTHEEHTPNERVVAIHLANEVAWETYQHKYRTQQEAKARRQATEADIAPAPLGI